MPTLWQHACTAMEHTLYSPSAWPVNVITFELTLVVCVVFIIVYHALSGHMKKCMIVSLHDTLAQPIPHLDAHPALGVSPGVCAHMSFVCVEGSLTARMYPSIPPHSIHHQHSHHLTLPRTSPLPLCMNTTWKTPTKAVTVTENDPPLVSA